MWRDPEHDKELEQSAIHEGWIYEFHKMRSCVIHSGAGGAGQDWGWRLEEHLLMGTFVFPLVVKLLLERDGLYSLTPDDVGSLRAIDEILLEKEWSRESKAGGWAGIVFRAKALANISAVLKT